MSMKITIITSPFGYVPPLGIGAVEKIWYDLSIEFVNKGNQVKIISKRPEHEGYTNNLLDKNGINNIYIKGYKRKRSVYLDLIFDFLYSINSLMRIEKTDILVMNTFWTPFLCRFFKKKYKVSIYNVARFPKNQFKYLSNVDKLVACGSMIGEAVIKQAPRLQNVCVINNPVNQNIYYFTSIGDIEDTVHVVYTGRLHPEKGLFNLVKALSSLSVEKKIKLSLIGTNDIRRGGGGKEYCNELKKYVKNFELDFVGEISDPTLLAQYMRTAHIYCYPPLPTTGDAMPCAPLEAMALGLPVIVSDIPCFDDYVFHEKNGIRFNVKENAVENLKAALEDLIENASKRRKLGLYAAETAKQFSCPCIADRFLDLFMILCDGEGLAEN